MMEENKPPAKLKQAKLSFLKGTVSVNAAIKSVPQAGGRKRRSSGVNGTESPSKTIKLAKPLVALDNADGPKAAKNGKVSNVVSKPGEDNNDHEVSSSSEAENGCGKSTSGTFLERFVRKIPPDGHQEISSTNEMLELSEGNKVIVVDLTKEPEQKVSEEECAQDAFDEPNAFNCIRTATETDDNSSDRAKSHIDPGKESASLKGKDGEQDQSESKAVAESTEAEQNLSKVESQEDADEEHKNIKINDTSTISECHDNSFDSSFLSVADSSYAETKADEEDTTVTPMKTSPRTPRTTTKKRTPKVDSAKKAELQAEKLRAKEAKENERLERKRKLEEEKAEKLRIKQEKKEAKDKERQEKKEKLEKERLEKEKIKEEERQKKEEEKLKKEDERKKKQAELEAKQEEKRKKEEEKRQKEEEKLREAEEKKKKEERTKQNFQSFFIKAKEVSSKPATPKPTGGIFIPFEVKKDMHLAPAVRREALSEDKKDILDEILSHPKAHTKSYLEQLRQGDIQPHKTGLVLRKNPQPPEDVEIVHDSETLKKVYHHVKLLQFHTDYRPPYYGTWRKHPKLSARNPWNKDEKMFDYEVDSDDEWEEEEPGESLSCSDGEEEKGDEVEEDEDDGWMVPHGYLSEDEGCNEDDEITPEKLKLQQLAKAKAWEEEQKRKLQAAPQITVGCFFEQSPSPTMSGDVRLLYEYRAVVLSLIPIPTNLFGSPEADVTEDTITDPVSTPAASKGCQKMAVPDEAMPDLIRLVHGNPFGIKKLIREFRVYWKRKLNPVESDQMEISTTEDKPESTVEKVMNESLNEPGSACESDKLNESNCGKSEEQKIIEEGNNCNISKRQLEMKITSMAVREKRSGFNRTCWYVHEDILKQFNMAEIALPNTWEFLTFDPTKSPGLNIVNPQKKDLVEEEKVEEPETPAKPAVRDQRSITEFALSKAEIDKLAECQPGKNSEEITLKSSKEETPKGGKKLNSQRFIWDFAKKSSTKPKVNSGNNQSTNPNACSIDSEMIDCSTDFKASKNDAASVVACKSGNVSPPAGKASQLTCVSDLANKEKIITFDKTETTSSESSGKSTPSPNLSLVNANECIKNPSPQNLYKVEENSETDCIIIE